MLVFFTGERRKNSTDFTNNDILLGWWKYFSITAVLMTLIEAETCVKFVLLSVLFLTAFYL